MLENFKKIDNPLTVIGVFAAVSEISMATIAALSPELRPIFLWFVMGFPPFLVALFFATLNFNHRVLYAPSDFRDDSSFVSLAVKGASEASDKLQNVEAKIEELRVQIEASGTAIDGGAAKASISNTVNQLASEVTEAQKAINTFRNPVMTFRHLKVLLFLCAQPGPVTVSEIHSICNIPQSLTRLCLYDLAEKGFVSFDGSASKEGMIAAVPTDTGRSWAESEFQQVRMQLKGVDDPRSQVLSDLEEIRRQSTA